MARKFLYHGDIFRDQLSKEEQKLLLNVYLYGDIDRLTSKQIDAEEIADAKVRIEKRLGIGALPKENRHNRARRVAALVLFFAGILFCAERVYAFRFELLPWIFQEEQQYTAIRQASTENPNLKTLKIAWVPEGFSLVEKSEKDENCTYIYENGQEEWIVFIRAIGSNYFVDTEGCALESISYAGKEARLYVKEGVVSLVWEIANDVVHIRSNIEKEALVKLLGHIE